MRGGVFHLVSWASGCNVGINAHIHPVALVFVVPQQGEEENDHLLKER